MTFIHKPLPFEPMEAEKTKKGRVYITPIGPLLSVTTLIGHSLDKSGLEKWQVRVGKEEAEAIRYQASERGDNVHGLCERYVRNDPSYKQDMMPCNLETFYQIKPLLDRNLTEVYGLELPLWSKVLRSAGKTDTIGLWDGKKAVIDYKTSKRVKTEKHALGYMIQGTAYGLMMYERYKMEIERIVVIIATDHEQEATVFDVPITKYYKDVKRIFIDREAA